MTKAEEIAKKWGILHYESGEVNKDVLEALNEALRQPLVSGELPISCVNDFEKPEYCSQRNNHLCQKCKDW